MKQYIVNPVVVRADASANGSIYEAIVAMGIRARQINDDIKAQITARMAHISPIEEETDVPNYDQMEISKEFDVIPKPSFLAMREMLEHKLTFRIEKPL